MRRGRPLKSEVRNKIERILDACGSAYGYEIYKLYKEAYPKTSLRNIYYHLGRGTRAGIFVVLPALKTNGNFTWGSAVEHKNYVLGHNASEKADARATEAVKKLGIKKRTPAQLINWKEMSQGVWGFFEKRLEGAGTEYEKRELMEEYGRIRHWFGRRGDAQTLKKVESKVARAIK